jgi:hypothetical protein
MSLKDSVESIINLDLLPKNEIYNWVKANLFGQIVSGEDQI